MIYVKDTEPAKLYHRWTAVMTLTACLKRKCWLRWGINDTLYPNLYTVLVGPPGNRKGTAMKVGEWFLDSISIVKAPSATSPEALVKQLKEQTVQETTADGHHITHASLTIWSPEWAVFLGRKDNHFLFSTLTDWYDCANVWNRLTIAHKMEEVTGVWVNMFGAITPKAIKSVIPYEAEGGGLLSRIIFVYEERPYKRVPDPFETPDLVTLREELLNDLNEIQQLSGQFQITGEAFDFYSDWYINMEKTNPTLPTQFEGYLARRQVQLLKLSMVMSVSESSDMKIGLHHMKRALKLLKATEVKMPRTFSGFGTARDSQLLEDLMVYVANKQRLHVRELFVQFRSFITDAKHMESLLQTMARSGFCLIQPTVKGTIIEYNPNNPLNKQYGNQPPQTKSGSGNSSSPQP